MNGQYLRADQNPFRTERTYALRYRLRGESWEDVLRRLKSLKYRAAVVGQQGSGKTTFLQTLGELLQGQGYTVHFLKLSAEKPRVDSLILQGLSNQTSSRDLYFLDGAEQLNLHSWLRFRLATRHAGGLVITTHRQGRLPLLYQCKMTSELLLELLRELVPHGRGKFQEKAISGLTRYDGNCHLIFRELYQGC